PAVAGSEHHPPACLRSQPPPAGAGSAFRARASRACGGSDAWTLCRDPATADAGSTAEADRHGRGALAMLAVESDWQRARAKVSRSSFYVAMRLMPKPRREAMFAIYAFNRAIDDIADEGDFAATERLAQLDLWRAAIDAIYA